MSGRGVATNYTWKEEAYELEITVQVPAETRAKDVLFQATSRSIDLRLGTKVLLDKERPLRGRVNLDGTYWVISDPTDDDDDDDNSSNGIKKYREVTVTIEKLLQTPRDDFAIVEYDWKGVYAVEDEGEVTERHYDEPEPLDVRAYAANMGVDIDNIDMSKVDKTMFGNNLNMTQQTLNGLHDAGYLDIEQQVTRQADGTEYITDEDGNPVPVSPLGEKTNNNNPQQQPPVQAVPFLDTDSPWHKVNETVAQQTRNFTRAAFAKDSAQNVETKKNPFQKKQQLGATDPIDLLTVAKLKEILKTQGLKVSGSKQELQERLRSQVNSLLQGKEQDAP